jgi:predicted nucleic acid-binding protein
MSGAQISLVLDSSITLARVFPDEWTPTILNLFREQVAHGALVPDLWKLEVANILAMSVRNGWMIKDRRDKVLVRLQRLPIEVDSETGQNAWGRTLELADRHNLTLYDSTYLELALRRSLRLATLDFDLRNAAQAEGVKLLGL